MENVVRVTLLMIFLTMLSACSQQTEVSTLSKILTWMQIGGSQDYWLEERSFLSPDQWDKVALIFGYAHDYDGCTDLVEAMKLKTQDAPEPAQFRCIPVN